MEAKEQERKMFSAKAGDENLGPLKLLPGTWKNLPNLPGRGWNMIALPSAKAEFNYRLLLNQYNEDLKFTMAESSVPNRGISNTNEDADQFVTTLNYEQIIHQVASADFPESQKKNKINALIHHESGFWLHMLNKTTKNLNIARLATIPHGNSVLALGKSKQIDGSPAISERESLPIGVEQNLNHPYLFPYKHFQENPFIGIFNPLLPNELLRLANEEVNILKTTILELDTSIENGGIVNIPFIQKQANATEMKATFWIQELEEKDEMGNPQLRLQYSQVLFLEFFQRQDGKEGLIRWPHISINTLEKIS